MQNSTSQDNGILTYVTYNQIKRMRHKAPINSSNKTLFITRYCKVSLVNMSFYEKLIMMYAYYFYSYGGVYIKR